MAEQLKFRLFETSEGKLVVAGKNAEQNELVVEQAKPSEILIHTETAGSPFCLIKNSDSEITKKDIHEASIFCARHSREWKQHKKDVEVHVFKKKDTYKTKDMKLGTFGVRKIQDKFVIKKGELERALSF